MTKILAILLTIAVLCGRGSSSLPNGNESETEFSLINYIETHEVQSYEEFETIISSVSPEDADEIDSDSVKDFSISIDYDNKIVTVTTVEEALVRGNGVGDTASRSYYSDVGKKIFTISLTADFTYYTGYCSTTSASGSYTRAYLSTWTSTPTISSGNYSASVAYARISGTATSGLSSINYSLTMTCDDTGDINVY